MKILSVLMIMAIFTSCGNKEREVVEINLKNVQESALSTERADINELEKIANDSIIQTESIVKDKVFDYEDVLKAETVAIQFVQSLFSYDEEKSPIEESIKKLTQYTVDSKDAYYAELYKELPINYEKMTATDTLAMDYNTQKLLVNDEEINTIEFRVSFRTSDNLSGEIDREHFVYIVQEGQEFKVFSNNKAN